MSNTLLVVIVLLAVILSGNIVSAQGKPVSGEPSPDKKEKPSKVLMRARAKGNFEGTVTHIDTVSKTIAVKNKGIIVTFDVSNPVLKGYKSFEQIKTGDKVAVSYIGDGAMISKITGTGTFQQEIAKPRPEVSKPKQGVAKTNKGRPVRIRERTNSREFRDVDNNNDGRITPVELSAILPNLTVEEFKKYDRNGHGYLNESEYNAVRKSVMRDR